MKQFQFILKVGCSRGMCGMLKRLYLRFCGDEQKQAFSVHVNAPSHPCTEMSVGLFYPNQLKTLSFHVLAAAGLRLTWQQSNLPAVRHKAPRAPPPQRSSTHLSQTLNVPVGKRYCQQFRSSSELKTRSLCFSEVMCCCHCFSLLQFFPHSQQWLPACKKGGKNNKYSHIHSDWSVRHELKFYLCQQQRTSAIFSQNGKEKLKMDSPLPQCHLWACGSVCRSPALRCWPSLHPSLTSETAATAHKAAPSLQLNRVEREGRQCDDAGLKRPEVHSDMHWKAYCCSPSCRSKGLFLQRCAQMCSSQCRHTSSRLSRACRSRNRRERFEGWLERFASSIELKRSRWKAKAQTICRFQWTVRAASVD